MDPIAPPVDFDRQLLEAVTDRHVHRYESRLDAVQRKLPQWQIVRVHECEMYLAIWQDIRDSIRRYDGERIPLEIFKIKERTEILDAYESGEFDE
jgi:hypothetical protein